MADCKMALLSDCRALHTSWVCKLWGDICSHHKLDLCTRGVMPAKQSLTKLPGVTRVRRTRVDALGVEARDAQLQARPQLRARHPRQRG